jgi:hypothetical protein
VTKYKRVYRAVYRMSNLRSEMSGAGCRYQQPAPVGPSREAPSLPSRPADAAAHSYPVDMAGEGGRARAADRNDHLRA